MSINISSNFLLGAGLPLDARTVVANTTQRDSIPSVMRYDGLKVYVEADNNEYQLQGGIANGDWVNLGTAGGRLWAFDVLTNELSPTQGPTNLSIKGTGTGTVDVFVTVTNDGSTVPLRLGADKQLTAATTATRLVSFQTNLAGAGDEKGWVSAAGDVHAGDVYVEAGDIIGGSLQDGGTEDLRVTIPPRAVTGNGNGYSMIFAASDAVVEDQITDGTNLLSNPQFTTWAGADPDSWVSFPLNGGTPFLVKDQTYFYSTPYASRLVSDISGNQLGIYQSVTGITPGLELYISMFIRGVSGGEEVSVLALNNDPITATQVWNFSGVDIGTWTAWDPMLGPSADQVNIFSSLTTSYQKYTTFNTPANGGRITVPVSNSITVVAIGPSGANNSAIIDDVSLATIVLVPGTGGHGGGFTFNVGDPAGTGAGSFNGVFRVNGPVSIYPPVASRGASPSLRIVDAANTGLSAGADLQTVYVDLSSTKTWEEGNISEQSQMKILAPTLAIAGAGGTIADAYTVIINGAPTAGAGATITNAWGMGIGGNVRLEGELFVQDGSASAGAIVFDNDRLWNIYRDTDLYGQNVISFAYNSQDILSIGKDLGETKVQALLYGSLSGGIKLQGKAADNTTDPVITIGNTFNLVNTTNNLIQVKNGPLSGFGLSSITETKTGTLSMSVVESQFTGIVATDYVVKIDDATPGANTFKWSDDGGATWDATGVPCSGSTSLNNGVVIYFNSNTGADLNDQWAFSFQAATKKAFMHIGGGWVQGSAASLTDFPNAFSISSQGDTGYTDSGNAGLVGEALADGSNGSAGLFGIGTSSGTSYGSGVAGVGLVGATGDTAAVYGVTGSVSQSHTGGMNIGVYGSSGNGDTSYGVYGVGTTHETHFGCGVGGFGFVAATGDTGFSYGVAGQAIATHAGGANVGVFGYALNGADNFSFYGFTGHIYNTGGLFLGTNSYENLANFTYAKSIITETDTGATRNAYNIGLVVEGGAGSSRDGYGVIGIGKGDSANSGIGVSGIGIPTATSDTDSSVGVSGEALNTHASGWNIGVTGNASGGSVNYSFYGTAGIMHNEEQVEGTYFKTTTVPTVNSSGTVAIVAKDAETLTNNAGWLPMKRSDGTVVYIPYWT